MLNQSRTSKVLALSFGRSLTILARIVSGMVAARMLTQHDYATMRQTMLAYQFVAPLLTLALPQALYYFLPREINRKKGIVLDNIILLTFMGAIFSLFLLAGGNEFLAWRFSNQDLEKTLLWMVPYPLFTLPAGIIGAVLVVQQKVNTLVFYNIISSLLLTISIIGACILTRSYAGPIIIQVVFSIVLLPLVFWLVFSNVSGKNIEPDFSSMHAMVKYSVPMGLATILSTITLQLDKIIVSSMCSPEEFAVYTNGAIEIPLIGIITGSMGTVILAEMAASCQKGDHAAALDLFRKAAIRSALILMPAMVFLLVFAQDFILILYSERYLESVTPFRIYLLALPIRIVYYGSALMALGLTKVILWRSIGELVINVCLSILLVHYIGYMGAAFATVLTLYLWSLPLNIKVISKGFKCNSLNVIPTHEIFQTFIVALLAATITFPLLLWQYPSHFIRLPVAALLFSTIYFMLAQRFISEFRDITKQLTSNLRKIIHNATRTNS